MTSLTLTIVIIELVGDRALQRAIDEAERQAASFEGVDVISIARGGEDASDFAFTIPGRRRLGLDASKSTYTALVEDTIRLSENWVQGLLSALHAHSPEAVFGPIRMAESLPPRAYALGLHEYGPYIDCGAGDRIPGACMVFKTDDARSCLEGAEEGVVEHDLAQRLKERGKAIECRPELWVEYAELDPYGAKLSTRFSHGRYYAASVLIGKSLSARIVSAVKALVLPLVMIRRAFAAHRKSIAYGARQLPIGSILAISTAWSFGEFIGSIAGMGRSEASWR